MNKLQSEHEIKKLLLASSTLYRNILSAGAISPKATLSLCFHREASLFFIWATGNCFTVNHNSNH